MPLSGRTHSDYSVGWICPLEVEQIAATLMLEERHEALTQPHTDHNVYTLGSIHGHNIVIAGLPAPGNCPAAIVATQMRATFPQLSFGLLVGIGGGVPTTTDDGHIRLGDLVVSKPTLHHSGAIQYDHGKAEQGQFVRTGFIMPAPTKLLNAAQRLAVERTIAEDDYIMTNLSRINTSSRRLRKFSYPGREYDRLFRPEYAHCDAQLSCDECGCDLGKTWHRDDDRIEPEVIIHRGTVASGELVVKNGNLRDQLARTANVLCFETEAAGALADFQCLVIRGIADYCDSHKNNKWHGYAAALAAAYARAVLEFLPLEDVTQIQTSQRGQYVQMILRVMRGRLLCFRCTSLIHLCYRSS